MVTPKKKKMVLKIKPSSGKVRRVWGIKPESRVQESTRKSRLEEIRRKETRD